MNSKEKLQITDKIKNVSNAVGEAIFVNGAGKIYEELVELENLVGSL